jgi:hypothetical protein
MPIKQLPWPDVSGAKNADGHLCVGSHPSRSKHCRTLLEFYRPPDPKKLQFIGTTYKVLATDVDWMKHDLRTIAVFTVALRDLVEEKINRLKPPRTGGFIGTGVVTQLSDGGLGLYEAGHHATIYPRFRWRFPFSLVGEGHTAAIAMAIRLETLRPDILVAEPDRRLGVSVPDGPELPRVPRFEDTWSAWLDEYLAQREATCTK